MTRRRLLAAATAAWSAALAPGTADAAGTGFRLWTFGDSVLDCGRYNAYGVLGVPAAVARRGHERMNEILHRLAKRHGRLADLHAHFLTGDPSWFANTIEPSLTGASEIRRVFLAAL